MSSYMQAVCVSAEVESDFHAFLWFLLSFTGHVVCVLRGPQ